MKVKSIIYWYHAPHVLLLCNSRSVFCISANQKFSKGISIHRTCCQTPCQIIATDPSPHVLSQHIQRRYRAGMVAHLQQVALLVSSKKLHHDPSRSPFSWGEGGQSSTVPTTSAGASSSFAPSTLPTYCSSSSTKPCDLSLEITSSTSCQS